MSKHKPQQPLAPLRPKDAQKRPKKVLVLLTDPGLIDPRNIGPDPGAPPAEMPVLVETLPKTAAKRRRSR